MLVAVVRRINSDEFRQVHQEVEQGESAKNDGANSNRQCSVALKKRFKINCDANKDLIKFNSMPGNVS
jgi:hypothetical protein